MAQGDVSLLKAEKDALLLRLEATALEGGSFSSPHQKTVEIASVLREVLTAVTVTP